MSFDFFNQNQAQSGSGPALGPNGEEILTEVKCGRIIIDGRTMTPDQSKGLLRICKADDGLCHLQFGARDDMPYNPDDDFIIFPAEAQMKFIPKPGCFVVKFPDDPTRNMFFWSQELAGAITDERLAADVNNALNGRRPEDSPDGGGDAGGQAPQAARAQAIRAAAAAAASALAQTPGRTVEDIDNEGDDDEEEDGEEEDEDGGTVDEQDEGALPVAVAASTAASAPSGSLVSSSALMAAFGNLSGTSTSGATSGGGGVGGSGTIDAAAMAAALAGLTRGGGGGGGTAGSGRGQQRAPAGPALSDIFTPESIGPLLRNADVRQRLLEHLPPQHAATQDLEQLMHTPQFKAQLERFSHALQSGQMDLAQFGLSPGTGFSIAEFLRAIQAQAQISNDAEEEKGAKKDTESGATGDENSRGGGGGGDDNAMTE